MRAGLPPIRRWSNATSGRNAGLEHAGIFVEQALTLPFSTGIQRIRRSLAMDRA
jgi:hypothetical protein